MSLNLRGYVHWPTPLEFLVILLIGGALLLAAIAIRRKYASRTATTVSILVLVLAGLWNGTIFLAFLSPHNRHVMHLATHRASVIANAVVGFIWLRSVCTVR
jgi:hypothetical protein